jgi:hypothetical protein
MPADITGLASDGYHASSGRRERSSKLARSVFVPCMKYKDQRRATAGMISKLPSDLRRVGSIAVMLIWSKSGRLTPKTGLTIKGVNFQTFEGRGDECSPRDLK